jgi:DNA transformation protein and related proteins
VVGGPPADAGVAGTVIRTVPQGVPRPMSATFLEIILDRLAPLGEVTSRPLFGGHGIYWSETIFAILFEGRLYLKVDDESKAAFEARDMGPFRPNDRQTLKSYYEVPPEVLDDAEALLSWAGEAIRAAQESQGPVA